MQDFKAINVLSSPGELYQLFTHPDNEYQTLQVGTHNIVRWNFRVRACANAHVGFMSQTGESADIEFEIVIGAVNNTKVSLERKGKTLV